MSDDGLPEFHLIRINSRSNQRRFYRLILCPNLFGGTDLVREFGRIGFSGRIMMASFDTEVEASEALRIILNAKRRRGYCDLLGDLLCIPARVHSGFPLAA